MSTLPELPPNMQYIDLRTLQPAQLMQMQQDIEQELKVFENSIITLKVALDKFKKSGECLEKVKPKDEGRQILVPLTGSMYVPGTLKDSDRVIIDIGASYYTEHDLASARDYFKRKVEFVNKEMERIGSMALTKSKLREALIAARSGAPNAAAAKS